MGLPLTHTCDLLKAEMMHFLGCLERYFRTNAIQGAANTFERSLAKLAERLREESSSSSLDFDVLEQAHQLHIQHLQRLAQDCLLAPGLSSVLNDLKDLIDMAAELHSVIEA